ncbi:hypothetical protein [Conexibacter sp. DBS9H8]|uniref:hypothetical protein n=1 Tax=Conexibacter sp. DBS9H8 TaxID=2937801 RepID=UPI002010A5FB|nr:hypothetical protein [Conexibacter sp. DBS9H8]
MSTKDIRPSHAYMPCDICGRTLLRGERIEVFIAGGNRHQVCELCKPRALQEGWLREGSVPDFERTVAAQERRRPLLRRRRREEGPDGPPPAANLDQALSGGAWPVSGATPPAEESRPRRRDRPAPRERPPARERTPRPAPPAGREPRHVHAVPTGEDSKIAAAVEAFNASEHPRTVAGVARSLGAPTVAVLPDPAHATLVRVTASWELCWYRYEVDLGAGRPSVRLDAQGYELAELSERELIAAAAADDGGRLHPLA